MKSCTVCKEIKSLDQFSNKKSGKDSQCKKCRNNYQIEYRKTEIGKQANCKGYTSWRINNPGKKAHKESLRRCRQLKATPKWANLYEIKKFYENCPKGYHVDHIIPLKGKNISGLHVIGNLQYLPAKENLKKGNRYG